MSECKQMHLNIKAMGRKDGSALKKASYRSTMPLYDARLNCTFKSNCNDDFIGRSKILAPEGTPEELLTQEGLWNAAEAAERKSNSVYAQEFNAGLPHELNKEQQEDLIDDFVLNHYVKRGIICDTNIHLKPTNNHFHGMMTTRAIDHSTESKFAKGKARDWWKMGSVQKDREAYCGYINKHLEAAGSDVRYDHRTLEAQGIDRKPQIHVGEKAKAMDERGEHSDRVEINNNIINFNAASAKLKASKAKLEKAEAEKYAKQKADQDLSAKKELMMQSQREYLRLHGKATRVWSVRKPWMAQEPTKPVLDTLDGAQHQKAVSQWKFEGSEIRAAMKSVVQSIRSVITDYFSEFKSDIRDDIKHIDNNHHENDDIEINGP